jgi:mRNA-degrading endonuclease RelE of RelBE toxin-antitoxin system
VKEFHRLRVPDRVAETIRGLHPTLKQQIRTALQFLIERPTAGKALKNELAGLRSYRVGRARIVYRLAGERIIEIVAIPSIPARGGTDARGRRRYRGAGARAGAALVRPRRADRPR